MGNAGLVPMLTPASLHNGCEQIKPVRDSLAKVRPTWACRKTARPLSPLGLLGGLAFPGRSADRPGFHCSPFAQCVRSAISFARQRRSIVRTARRAHSRSAGE